MQVQSHLIFRVTLPISRLYPNHCSNKDDNRNHNNMSCPSNTWNKKTQAPNDMNTKAALPTGNHIMSKVYLLDLPTSRTCVSSRTKPILTTSNHCSDKFILDNTSTKAKMIDNSSTDLDRNSLTMLPTSIDTEQWKARKSSQHNGRLVGEMSGSDCFLYQKIHRRSFQKHGC